jgi:hypothetical protein
MQSSIFWRASAPTYWWEPGRLAIGRAGGMFIGRWTTDLQKRHARRLLPPEIAQFADAFISMQEQRHIADYDPISKFTRAEVVSLIDGVEQAIIDYKKAPRSDKLAFAVLVLLKLRDV